MAEAIYSQVRVAPSGFLGMRGPIVLDERILVHVEGFDPLVPLKEQLEGDEGHRKLLQDAVNSEEHSANQAAAFEKQKLVQSKMFVLWSEIINLIRSGASESEVQGLISARQAWPCFALVTKETDLERELLMRYCLGRCEVDFGGFEVVGKILIVCRMIPQSWRPAGCVSE